MTEETTPVKELEMLLGKVDGIKEQLQAMKLKAEIGEQISSEELRLAVEDISSLDAVMRPRQDVGH